MLTLRLISAKVNLWFSVIILVWAELSLAKVRVVIKPYVISV